MEFLSLLYTVLLVAICLQQALLLYRSGNRHPGRTTKPSRSGCVSSWTPVEALCRSRPSWPGRTYDAMRGISETLQTAVQV